MRAWPLALKLLARDWRGGEPWLLSIALALTVAAVTAAGFFTDRIERAMQRQGGELIAADLAIASGLPIPATVATRATVLGLRTARFVSFRSVAVAGAAMQLVEVKAVSPDYPLRGALRVRSTAAGEERSVTTGPAPGTLWVEPRVLAALGLRAGDTLGLGAARLRIDRIIAHEPDRGANFFQLAPRVLLAEDDLPATGLVGEASRVSHHLLVAGAPGTLDEFARWLRAQALPAVTIADARDARPEFATAVERAGRFLRLAALATLLVAGAAIGLASRRLIERQTDAVAVMRCLGAPPHLILRLFALRLLALGLSASLIGCLLGYLGQRTLVWLLGDWFGGALPAASWQPVGIGLATGLVALAGFALPPLAQLARVPPLRALRRDLGPPGRGSIATVGAAALALAALTLWQAADPALAARLLLGVAGALVALTALGALLVWLARLLVPRARGLWRLGLAGVARRPGAAVLQIVGFGLGILALLLLAVVRVDLLQDWSDSLPEDAPNHFLINIQPHEVAALEAFFAERGIVTSGFHPMIRARLTAIDGRPVKPDSFSEPRARRLSEREFNLSVATAPRADNRIVAGAWWDDAAAAPQFSLEVELAELLGIGLGEELRFWVAGRELAAPVTSLREVRWDSFNVNFFVIASPALLDGEPATYVTSFHLPARYPELLAELLARFPSVTPLDVATLLGQVRSVIEQGVRAVEFVFAFTLAAGFLVMLAGIQASLASRRAEQAVLRGFGASRRQLLGGLLVEFTVTGLLAGLVASLFAALTGWLVATELLGIAFGFNPWLWLIGVLGGGLAIGLAGTLGSDASLRRPPSAALRAAD